MTEPIVSTFNVAVDGQSLACLKTGAGPAVVIVHGIGGRKEDWQPLAEALSASHTAYAVDMIGFGASSKSSPAITIRQQVETILALIDHEGLATVAVVGNSLGGWVAAAFAARHPERVGRLVLADAAGLRVTLSGPPPVNFAPNTVEEMQQLLATVLLSPFARTREFAAQAFRAFEAGGEAVTLGKLFAGFADPASPDRPLDDLLPQVQAPTLVLWGEEDGLFPAALADVVAAGIPGSRKQLVPRASHFPQIDNPGEFNAAVAAFLAA